MSKPKKITVRYIESNATVKPSKDDDKKGLEEKQDENPDGCTFC